jgi:hopanoid biosynthesis associated radical SAM protein HpnH
MAFPIQLNLRLVNYLIGKKLSGQSRFPLVLMLEPTHLCNLRCAGCGRIREYSSTLEQQLSVEECLASVEEAGAPVVAVTGGEPLLHPGIQEIVTGIIRSKRFVYLCTNGLVLERSLEKFQPSPYLAINVHLDGLAPTHDGMAGREGVFETALNGIQAAKEAGFQVCTNTTVYKGSRPREIRELLQLLMYVGVDGLLLSPAFGYEAVDQEVFLSREETIGLFREILRPPDRRRYYSTPLYLDFLKGERELECTPWANPTRNPQGWKSPCYLITDRHFGSLQELMEQTEWEKYGVGRDPRCENCMVHSGFEATAVSEAGRDLGALWKTLKWSLS